RYPLQGPRRRSRRLVPNDRQGSRTLHRDRALTRSPPSLDGWAWRATMNVTRREVLASLGTLAASAAFNRLEAHTPGLAAPDPFRRPALPELPRKADFTIADGYTYINGAFSHPMPRA